MLRRAMWADWCLVEGKAKLPSEGHAYLNLRFRGESSRIQGDDLGETDREIVAERRVNAEGHVDNLLLRVRLLQHEGGL